MIKVNGLEIDFDITAPDDVRRYIAAGDKMTDAAATLSDLPCDISTRDGYEKYISFLTVECKLLTDFIDEAFGNGVCNSLLGKKMSLEKLLDICNTIGASVEAQGKAVGVKIQKYTPNRAIRRAQK
ncbi:MAG: DUF6673 family protein [Oscillospiraceae bacterium]